MDVIRCPDVEQSIEVQRVGPLVRWGARDVHGIPVHDLGYNILYCAPRCVAHLEHLGVPNEVARKVVVDPRERCTHVCALEQLGVVAHLAKLHDEVHESLDGGIVRREGRSAVHEVRNGHVLAQGAVHVLLARREIAEEVDLNLQLVSAVAGSTRRTLSPSSFCTFFLILLSMNGLRIMCSRRSCPSFISPFLSPTLPSMSRENHSLNSSWLSKREGMIK